MDGIQRSTKMTKKFEGTRKELVGLTNDELAIFMGLVVWEWNKRARGIIDVKSS